MQQIENVRSTMRPNEVELYGETHIDYNYDIEEIVTLSQEQVKDENGEVVLNEEGEPETEEIEIISYEYKTKRFDNQEEFDEWRTKNL